MACCVGRSRSVLAASVVVSSPGMVAGEMWTFSLIATVASVSKVGSLDVASDFTDVSATRYHWSLCVAAVVRGGVSSVSLGPTS